MVACQVRKMIYESTRKRSELEILSRTLDWKERLLIDDDLKISVVVGSEELTNECTVKGKNILISLGKKSYGSLISLEEIIVHELIHVRFPKLDEEEVRDLAVTLTQLKHEK